MSTPAERRRIECLDEGEILRLHEGALRGDERAGIEVHLDTCESCRRLVAASAPTDPSMGARGSDVTAPAPPQGDASVLGRGAGIGRYLVLSLLGQGGMGAVYAAYDPELDRRVAIKLLHTAHGSERSRALCMREARTLGKLSHPNVVQVHDVGEHEGDVFLAMELVDGRTLDAWCRLPPRPGFREVLAAYLEAARGISAAHAKGIVHRDIKPSNILRGEDGRVRVADFGLASIVELERGGDDAAPVEARPSSPEARLTATGALLGTPLYMAPEQHESPRMTAASDQYSFCVALHEALYGAPPFVPEAREPAEAFLADLLAQKKIGLSPSPPAGTDVPAWVYEALARGLAPDPAHRYPSMDALIAALRDDRDARRRARWRSAGAGAIAAALLGVAAAGWIHRGSAAADRCARPEEQLSGVWDDGVKGAVRAAFLGTGRPYAEAITTRVLALLDRHASAYASMRVEVCEAGRKGTQAATVVGLREACLERRRAQLQALTTLFAEKPDAKVLDNAIEAASGLYPVSYCADTESLTASVPPPEDPAMRAKVARLEPQVDRLEVLQTAGKFKEGLALGEALTAEAGELPYAPLRARLQCWMGSLRDETGDYEAAKDLLRRAAVSALEGRDDVTAATAWGRLLMVVAERQQRPEEAEILRALSPVVVRTRDERTLGVWLNMEGASLVRAGKYAEGRDRMERALTLLEKAGDAEGLEVAALCNNLGTTLNRLGERQKARATLERSLAIFEKAFGPEHPRVAAALNNLGNMLQPLGESAQARAYFERALAIWTKAQGPNHPLVGFAAVNLGLVAYDLGDDRGAAEHYERALAILEKSLGPDNVMVSWPLEGLGRARTRLGQLDAALPLLERALALREKVQGASHPELAHVLLALAELSLARRQPARAVPLLERAQGLHNADRDAEVGLALAEALWQIGDDRARARTLAEGARAAYERLGHRPGTERASRWLADHPG